MRNRPDERLEGRAPLVRREGEFAVIANKPLHDLAAAAKEFDWIRGHRQQSCQFAPIIRLNGRFGSHKIWVGTVGVDTPKASMNSPSFGSIVSLVWQGQKDS